MQFRFRTWDEEKKRYKLLGYTDIEDYDVAFKMFSYMYEYNCRYCVELNDLGVEEEGENYYVIGVSFVAPKVGEDLMPHIVVDLEEDF